MEPMLALTSMAWKSQATRTSSLPLPPRFELGSSERERRLDTSLWKTPSVILHKPSSWLGTMIPGNLTQVQKARLTFFRHLLKSYKYADPALKPQFALPIPTIYMATDHSMSHTIPPGIMQCQT
jgi:hypothetical protein